jgi:isopentenyl-diphosphate delta-isomerase
MKRKTATKNLISKRKAEHLKIVVEKDVISRQPTLLNDIKLIHQALPELDFEQIDISSEFFGKPLKAPLMIASMTGGATMARRLNRALAEVAARQGIAFGVGSQRIMLRHPEMTADFAVRKWIGDGVLLGNIGAVQLEEYSPQAISEMVKSIEADGLCIHLNIGQELMQKEGHRRFRGLVENIRKIIEKLDGRVVVKETGAGLSVEALRQLAKCGVKYIDISGAGGTSWTKVEMYRAPDRVLRQTAATFADWGIPSAFSIIAAGRIMGESCKIIASGGLSNGLDIARAIAAGADMGAFARPILVEFMREGKDGAAEFIKIVINELKTAMLLTGTRDISALKRAARVYTGELRQWLTGYKWLIGDEK